MGGHKEACTLLILNGADIDIRTRANETVLDTVDPILKTELIEEIKKAQIEKEKTKNLNLQNEIILRNDAANKRRSSIARQSVECKKNAQMKESVSERQTLINARLNSESSGIITIDEADEKFSSPKDNSIEYHPEVDFNNLTEPFIDHKQKNIGKENLQIRPDKLYQNFNENPVADAKTERNLLSNGDNFKNNASVQITENLDSNNALTINNLRDGDDQHLEECIAPNDDAVVLRPKRLSLVMAPEKSEEAEVSRREKARRVRSTRRSTQAIDLGSIKEVEIRNSDIIKSQSINPENSSQTRLESINSGETNQYNIQADSHNDKDLKESTNFNYQNIKNETTDMNKSSSFCDRLNFDSVDSVEKKNLKHQNSCPSPRQDQIISRDVARLNITNKITALTRRKPGNLIKPIVSSVPIVSPLFVEKPTRGIDVNKCLESNNFSINRDANSRFPFKNSDNQSFLNSESIEEKNNGSFVAKPVSRNTLKAKTESDDIPNVPDTSKMIIYEHAEVSCSKDENPISKTILTRMINDQTTKQELAKENDSLKHKIKEYEDRIKQLEGDLLGTGKKNLGSESDKIAKLEIEKLKVREENQRLKSQNESLLRVISRIQQELENLR